MAGGSLTITAETYFQLTAAAERVLCWTAAANDRNVQVLMGVSPTGYALRVPEESFGAGSLVLRRGGTDLVAGYVAGTNITYALSNANVAVGQNANTCPASTNQPTISGLTTNVGGNPRATTLAYANVAAAGLVNIAWGDGTSTLGAAESGTANHTYPDVGTWTITVTDATDATQSATAVFDI